MAPRCSPLCHLPLRYKVRFRKRGCVSQTLVRPPPPTRCQPGLPAPAITGPRAPGSGQRNAELVRTSSKSPRRWGPNSRTRAQKNQTRPPICSSLTLVEHLTFPSCGDLVGKMEMTIIRTPPKKGFKNVSENVWSTRAVSCLGRIPPGHRRPLLSSGPSKCARWRPLPVGPCRTLPFGHLLTAFLGDPGCGTAFPPGKCGSSCLPDTCGVQAHVAGWGGGAAGPVPWALMAGGETKKGDGPEKRLRRAEWVTGEGRMWPADVG